MKPKIITFGCRLNIHESEIIRKEAEKAQLDTLEHGAIIFNTCAVTHEAVRQAKQAIRKAAKSNPQAKIIVTGCAAQTQENLFASMEEVDLVLGNEEKLQAHFYRKIPDFGVNDFQKICVNDIMEVRENAGHLLEAFEGKTRAFVQIQNGCDHRCTFCIIPYSRGPSRSVPMGIVVDQIKSLIDKNYKEIVLTGVDLTSYGMDLPVKTSLAKLLKNIFRHCPSLSRLRLSSIDSVEVDEELLELLSFEKRVMPHLHLSLQSGDNLILKRMKRRHLREDAIKFCQNLKSSRREMAFGADLIAGFPTETEDMFRNSLSLIDECDLTYLHVFPYSSREKTPAAKMPQVERSLIINRAAQLRRKGEEKYQAHLQKSLNKKSSILIEKENLGRGEDYSLVQIEGGLIGDIVEGYIYDHDCKKLLARPLI